MLDGVEIIVEEETLSLIFIPTAYGDVVQTSPPIPPVAAITETAARQAERKGPAGGLAAVALNAASRDPIAKQLSELAGRIEELERILAVVLNEQAHRGTTGGGG